MSKSIGSVFKSKENEKLYLIRCPICGQENYAMAVSEGICAWCGYHAQEKDIQEEE